MKELKIFVADDSDTTRQQLQTALAQIKGSKLVGMSAGNTEATKVVKELEPDIVVLDISLPHREAIEVLREIRSEVPQAEIIIFTADPSMVFKEVCFEAGADFYLHKTQLPELIEICSEQLVQV